jgi:hypothetical protein
MNSAFKKYSVCILAWAFIVLVGNCSDNYRQPNINLAIEEVKTTVKNAFKQELLIWP